MVLECPSAAYQLYASWQTACSFLFWPLGGFLRSYILDIAFKEIESLGHELVKAVRIEGQSYP
jgi:hypothetical protein